MQDSVPDKGSQVQSGIQNWIFKTMTKNKRPSTREVKEIKTPNSSRRSSGLRSNPFQIDQIQNFIRKTIKEEVNELKKDQQQQLNQVIWLLQSLQEEVK